MTARRYPIEYEGPDGWAEWIRPVLQGYRCACCDCGLVHNNEFVIFDRRGRLIPGAYIEWRTQRDDRATAGVRSGMKRRREFDWVLNMLGVFQEVQLEMEKRRLAH